MNVRGFTEEDRKWLIDYYPLRTHKECMEHLKCGRIALERVVRELGMEWTRNSEKEPKPQKEQTFIWADNGCVNFCQDCRKYRKDGICMKTGKSVGALWQKKCFKTKTKNT